MALEHGRVIQVADAIVILSNRTADLLMDIERTLTANTGLAIDWGAAEKPAYIDEAANGNLSGRLFTRQQVSNAIGSLDWVRKLLTNQSMTNSQGNHVGNLTHLARTIREG